LSSLIFVLAGEGFGSVDSENQASEKSDVPKRLRTRGDEAFARLSASQYVFSSVLNADLIVFYVYCCVTGT